MELNKNHNQTKTKQGNLYDPKERERLLTQYGGIFKKNISDFANTVIKKKKAQKNFSR